MIQGVLSSDQCLFLFPYLLCIRSVSFSIISVSVFISGISVFVSTSAKKYENEYDSTQFRPFPLRFHPYVEYRADRISDLLDATLGEIIFLLPTKDGSCTQVLASRRRTLWRTTPLNLDHRRLSVYHDFELHGGIICSRQGSVQRLCIPVCCLLHIPFMVNACLTSRQFEKLQHLEFYHYYENSCPPSVVVVPSPPVSISWFSSSLHTTTLARCHLPNNLVQILRLPLLKSSRLWWSICRRPHYTASPTPAALPWST